MDFRRNTTDYAKPRASAMPSSNARTVDAGLRAYMLRIYNYMASGLAVTGIVALVASQSPGFINAVYNLDAAGRVTGMSGLGWVLAFAPLAFIMALSFGVNKMKSSTMQMVFWAFATVMGLSMTNIFLLYTGESIARTFFVTAGAFGALSIFGYTTKKDLTGMGSFLFMGLIGIILASIVNIFLGSSTLGFAISVLGVLIFAGLTAYDTQRLKNMYHQIDGSGEAMKKAAIMGALSLYLDFINMFIHLLQFMGDRR